MGSMTLKVEGFSRFEGSVEGLGIREVGSDSENAQKHGVCSSRTERFSAFPQFSSVQSLSGV